MKKKLAILLVLLLTPLFVHADMGMPEMQTYEVKVTKKDGTYLYDYGMDKKITLIPKGTTIEIDYETYNDGKLIGQTNYDGSYGYVYLDDTELLNDEYQGGEQKWYYDAGEVLIIGDGVKLHKGPSQKYDLVDDTEIEVGTKLAYKFRDELWAYVQYNGKKGWIYIYQYFEKDVKVAYKEKDGSILTIRDTKLLQDVNSDDYDVTVPAGTELEYNYYVSKEPRARYVYVDYKGTKGWVYTGDSQPSDYDSSITKFDIDNYKNTNAITNYNVKYKVVSNQEIKVYKDIKFTESIGTLKKNDVVESKYSFYDYYSNDEAVYINSNGVKGWVLIDTEETPLAQSTTTKLLALEEIKVYDTYEKSNSIGKLTQYEEYEPVYTIIKDRETWYYVETKDIKGWFISDGNKVVTEAPESTIVTTSNVNIFKNPSKMEATKVIIPENTELNVRYYVYRGDKTWDFVEYEGTKGWIDTTQTETVEPEFDPEDVPEIEEDEDDKENKKDKKDKKENEDPLTLALIGVGAAIVVALTAIVSIVLVKKNKKKKLAAANKEALSNEEKAEEALAEKNINEAERLLAEEEAQKEEKQEDKKEEKSSTKKSKKD